MPRHRLGGVGIKKRKTSYHTHASKFYPHSRDRRKDNDAMEKARKRERILCGLEFVFFLSRSDVKEGWADGRTEPIHMILDESEFVGRLFRVCVWMSVWACVPAAEFCGEASQNFFSWAWNR